MPTYDFENKKTGEVFEKMMTIADKEQYLKDNPDIQQLLGMPNFRDILREIDKKHKGGRKGNNMNKHSSF